MKRYALFRGEAYYPGGGWRDFCSWHDTQEDAEAVGRALYDGAFVDWWHVADLTTGKIVAGVDYAGDSLP